MNRSVERVASRVLTIFAVAGMLVASLPAVASAAAPSSAPNPANFGGPIDNQWFPLPPGTTLVYTGTKDGKQATDIFHVTHRTRTIQGVRCVVVEDTLVLNGRIGEKTTDWYAQDLSGTVWYFGESTAEYDRHGNVVSTAGSWQSGVDGAAAGIFMPADPHVGDIYQQEFYPGQAEDHFQIRNLDAPVSVPYGSFNHALKTHEWTPLEPGVLDAKYYARGIGTVLEATVRGPVEVLRLAQVIRN